MSWFTRTFGGEEQRDAANEALDRSQVQINAGYNEAQSYQKTLLEQLLKNAGVSNDAIKGIIQQAMNYMQGQGQGMIDQRRQEAAQQIQGQKDTNKTMMDFYNRQLAQQTSENAPQLAARQQMLAAVMPQAAGMAAGTWAPGMSAMYNVQLGEMNKAINNAMAARGLGNSSAATNALREGQTKLAAQDQQRQFDNTMGIFNNLMNQRFSAVNPQQINLNNPYANVASIAESMQTQGQNMIPLYQAAANQAGLYGNQLSNAQAGYANNMGQLALGRYGSIANIAGQYGNVPQGGALTSINNLLGLINTGMGMYQGWTNPTGLPTQRKSGPTLSAS
jgi:hypothetical protein